MSKRTTIRLPEELLNRARRKAAAEGRTLSSLIEDGLRSVVSEPKKTDGRQAALLARVSKATGGLMPGIDPHAFFGHSGDGRSRVCRADEALQVILPDLMTAKPRHARLTLVRCALRLAERRRLLYKRRQW